MAGDESNRESQSNQDFPRGAFVRSRARRKQVADRLDYLIISPRNTAEPARKTSRLQFLGSTRPSEQSVQSVPKSI